jgi:phospholipid-binding lipoprotein MlaA
MSGRAAPGYRYRDELAALIDPDDASPPCGTAGWKSALRPLCRLTGRLMALPLILPLALAPIAAVVSAPEPATVEPDNSDAAAEVAAMAGESAEENAPIIVMGMAQSATRDGKNFQEAAKAPTRSADRSIPIPSDRHEPRVLRHQPADRPLHPPPARHGLSAVVPEPAREGVRNALSNIYSPSPGQ